MTILEVICKTVAVQNNSQWPCSMCPIPLFRLVGVRTSYIFNISWTPLQIPLWRALWQHPVTNLQQGSRKGNLRLPPPLPFLLLHLLVVIIIVRTECLRARQPVEAAQVVSYWSREKVGGLPEG